MDFYDQSSILMVETHRDIFSSTDSIGKGKSQNLNTQILKDI